MMKPRRMFSAPVRKQFMVASALLIALWCGLGVEPVAAQCSPAWTIMDSPNPSANGNQLYGVSVISETDVWAVGTYVNQSANAFQNVAMHWDGARWTITPTPNPYPGADHLKKVAAVAPNDVWIIGGHGVSYSLHWDGVEWKVVPTQNPGFINYLHDIAVVSANDIWAVGSLDEGGASRIHTLIEHWDGTSWKRIPSPNVLMPSGSAYPSRLNNLEVISANDIWAVGEYIVGNQFFTLIEHWDGTKWSIIPSPNGPAGDGRLWGVTAVSANDVWAVGEYASPAGSNAYGKSLILHWDGTSWSVVPSPQPSPWGASPLYNAVALSANDVWAVGSWANASQGMSTFVLHWDGFSWNQVSSPDMPGSGTGWNFLEDVAALNANEIWAVGRKQSSFGSAQLSLVERYSDPCPTGSVALSFLTLNPPGVIGGKPSQATVSLSGPAPEGGAVVTLSSSDTSIATVPQSVSIPAGATSASFTVTTKPVSTHDSAIITASWNDSTQQAAITISPAVLTSLTLNPTKVAGGTSSRGTVTLNGKAPAGGAVVSLVSNKTAIATVPASVTIPAGVTSVSFTIATKSVMTQTVVSISATYAGVTKGASLTVTPPTSGVTLTSLALNPASVTGGKASQGTVTLSGAAPSGGAVVALSSSNTAVATVPASVTIPAGASSATFNVTTKSVTTTTSVTLSASRGGVTRTATLTVTPAAAADTVGIQRAEYTSSKRELRVEASSSKASATLKVYVTATGQLIGTLTNNGGGRYSRQFTWSSNPQNITVRSSLGGSATKAVTQK